MMHKICFDFLVILPIVIVKHSDIIRITKDKHRGQNTKLKLKTKGDFTNERTTKD